MRFPQHYWHWVMRACALAFAICVAGTFLAPSGSTARFICYLTFLPLMFAFIWARGKARPGEDFALSEVVHCKSKKEEGVASALSTCSGRYLNELLSCSGALVIVLVGKKALACWNACRGSSSH